MKKALCATLFLSNCTLPCLFISTLLFYSCDCKMFCCVWCQNVHICAARISLYACTHEAVNAFAALFTLFIFHVNTLALISLSICTFVCVYKCTEAWAKLCMHNITSVPWPSLNSQLEMEWVRSPGTCAGVCASVELDSKNRIQFVYQNDGDENRSRATQKNTCAQINVVNGGLSGCPLWMDTHMLLETRPEDYLWTRTHTRLTSDKTDRFTKMLQFLNIKWLNVLLKTGNPLYVFEQSVCICLLKCKTLKRTNKSINIQ